MKKSRCIPALEAIATKMVGDGKRPNLYFAIDRNGCVSAIFRKRNDAADYYEKIRGPWSSGSVEDRITGTLWSEDE